MIRFKEMVRCNVYLYIFRHIDFSLLLEKNNKFLQFFAVQFFLALRSLFFFKIGRQKK